MNTFRLFLLFMLLLSNDMSGQDQQLDSLTVILNNARLERDRMEAYIELGSYWYSKGENEKAITMYEKVVKEHCSADKEKCIDAKNYIVFNLVVIEKYDQANDLLQQILEESEKIKYGHGHTNAYRNLGLLNTYQGNYEEAAGFYLKAIEFAQQTKNQMKEADLYADLVMNYYFQENYEKAAQYWEKAIELKPDKNSSDYIGYCANLGQAYVVLQKFDAAEKYFLKALDFYRGKNSFSYANALNGLGVLESHRKNKMKALEYFTEELQVRENNKSRNDALASVYLNISSVYTDMNLPAEALKYAQEGLKKAQLSDNKSELLHAYENINTAYSKMKNYEKAYEYSILFNDLRDSLSNIESKKNINELEAKYQTVQKEKKNQELKQQIEIKEIQTGRQRLIIWLIGIVVVALGIIAYVLVRQNKLKTIINAELALKNNIIQEKSKIVRDQHKDITDSINYAKRIQEAILPPLSHWKALLPDSFVLYQPKDILSGDFYWLYRSSDTIFFAAADCTGHGVPGAMVSVICCGALDRAVKEFGITEPGKILDKSRELILETFEKSQSEVKDGMDISLCALSLRPQKENDIINLKWAGANNPLLYLHNGELRNIAGNKQTVGKSDDPVPFTTQTVELEKGDMIYVFSDGYADQFGGPKGKKLKYKQLKEILLLNSHLSPEGQEKSLHKAFTDWKGSQDQVDDVCLIGLRV